jgi:glycosyltransferase involved in cell wall biosynthesis
MKILFIAPYPYSVAPSQRFRYEQYLEALKNQGHTFDIESFIDESAWKILYTPKNYVKKILSVLRAFVRRIILLTRVKKYDYVFIHREASHLGPPIFEWFIAKIFKKKIIYDFDDAIWIPNFSEYNKIFHPLKMYGKVKSIIRWSHKISAGNDYLCDFAREYNSNVVCNPTTIDTENHHNQIKNQNTKKVVIGWTGTFSTAKYIHEIIPVIQKLEEKYDFVFQVISNEFPKVELKSFQFKRWKKDTEIADLLEFNIGVMPLVDDKWANGKCGFKALQYMALGIPAVISPVGVNTKIVDEKINGFLCTTQEEWYNALAYLLENPDAREKMGHEARKKIEEHYSVKSNTSNFLRLFAD